MIYGLYLSASGVLTNSYRQDVIANNLANAETVGFKRSLAIFQARRTEADQQNARGLSNPTLENMGGGMKLAPTHVDHSQGMLERTNNNLDVAIVGDGYVAVNADGKTRLTRNGQFMLDQQGYLVLSNGSGNQVLDAQKRPIRLATENRSALSIGADGTLSSGREPIARIGLFDVPERMRMTQHGSTLLDHPDAEQLRPSANATFQSGFVETSNVDPMTELTQMITAHRQLEANANMIRYQDQTLGRLVNEVGKIS